MSWHVPSLSSIQTTRGWSTSASRVPSRAMFRSFLASTAIPSPFLSSGHARYALDRHPTAMQSAI
eukprot:scaffold155_cov347-Pavlova_lutheri.AAC.2